MSIAMGSLGIYDFKEDQNDTFFLDQVTADFVNSSWPLTFKYKTAANFVRGAKKTEIKSIFSSN